MIEDLEQNWALLEEEHNDPVELINKQVDYLQSVTNTSPYFVLEKSIALIRKAEQLDDHYAHARSKVIRGYAFYVISGYDKALVLLHEALSMIEGEQHTFLEFEIHGAIALIHISLGNFQSAIEHGYKTRALIQQLGNRPQEAWAPLNI